MMTRRRSHSLALLVVGAPIALLWPAVGRYALESQSHAATTATSDKSDVAQIDLHALDSPRLSELARELNRGNREALPAFWADVKGNTPLVEAGAEDHRRFVTFLWQGDQKTTGVSVLGGLPSANVVKPLRRLGETDVWYLTESHASEARFAYLFQVNGPPAIAMELRAIMEAMRRNPPRPDALHTREYAGWSYVELPDAPPQPWIVRQADIPLGRQTKERLKSQIENREYRLNIYTPPGYEDDGERCWLMIAFDGGFGMMDIILDNLRSAGEIPPLVVVGVENGGPESRQRDLDCSDSFASFLANELVPWARAKYRVYDDPAHTAVGGTSLGGKMAVYCGLRHSDVFGNVLSQSGSFLTAPGEETPRALWSGESPGLLARRFVERPPLPLALYIEVGRYETTLPNSMLLETRRLRDVLQAKGYRVTYSEFVGGHNEVCWRGSFANAIKALTSARPVK